MREKTLIENWLFHEGDIKYTLPAHKGPLYKQSKTERMKWGPACIYYNDKSGAFPREYEAATDEWQKVKIPHDYIINKIPQKEQNSALGYFKYENAWYRCHLSFSDEDRGKRIVLQFEGIATESTVYFNGSVLKRNYCGYTPFEVDITNYIRFDSDNVIAVYVNTENHEGWWYEGAGIYRNVYLLKTNKISVDRYGVYVLPEKCDDNWEIHFETTLRNDTDEDTSVSLITSVLDANNKVCAMSEIDTINIGKHTTSTEKHLAEISNPLLWDIEEPNLYTVKTDVYSDKHIVDTYYTRTGFRTYYADPEKGFFLNGKPLKIKGVCAHADFGLTGKAVANNVQRYRIDLLKEMGANGYRTSHYPHDEATMDALDEKGFIVMDETRWFGSDEETLTQLRTLILRDRNRPSVFFWSLGNEEPLFASEIGAKISNIMLCEAKKLDDTRMFVAATSCPPMQSEISDCYDVLAFNYNISKFDEIHNKYPQKPIISSECCATGTTRGWYFDDNIQKGYCSSYDKIPGKYETNVFCSREKTWIDIAKKDYVMGCYQWIAFEHRGECEWPRLCSQSGAIDLFLQKKDAFYQNQSHWTDKPMIHLLPHWNLGSERIGEEVKVWAYTNCDEAELVLNGKSVERVKVRKYTHIEWVVPFTPGRIEAIGYINGKVVTRDICETTGTPKELRLRLDNSVKKANGKDVAVITCYTVDNEGRYVPDATPYVEFWTNKFGIVVGTGSDISDHNSVMEMGRKMRAGLITLAVKVGEEAGKLVVYAKADGLESTRLEIELEE